MTFRVHVSGTYHVYMRTTALSASQKLPVTLTPEQLSFTWTMPTSRVQAYRFDAIPVELNAEGLVINSGPSLNEVLVRRKK